MLNDSIADWRSAGVAAFEFGLSHNPSEEQKEKLGKANAKYLPLFERQIKKNGNGFLVGNNFTLPDYMIFEYLEEVEPHTDLTNFPLIKELHQKLKALPVL